MTHPTASGVRAGDRAAPSARQAMRSGLGAVSGRERSPSKAAGFAVGKLGSLLIYVYGARAPTDAEWKAAVAYYQAAATMATARVLVYSNGGAPGAKQRAHFVRLSNGKTVRIAVLTMSALARAAAVAFRWFNPTLRLFTPAELEDALEFLSVPPAGRPDVRLMLENLKCDITCADPSIARRALPPVNGA